MHKKDAREDKDPPEGKGVIQSILAIFIESYTPIVIVINRGYQLLASYLYNADITWVLKQS